MEKQMKQTRKNALELVLFDIRIYIIFQIILAKTINQSLFIVKPYLKDGWAVKILVNSRR